MKILVLSAVLGMFCYCTNNAAEIPQPVKVKDINYILNFMITGQGMILSEKLKMLAQSKKIYSTIKDKHGKVTKKNVLDFIQNQISTKDKTDEELKDDIKKIEQYFHLEEIKEDNNECNEGNLTEIFWEKGEEGDVGEEKIEDVVDEIKSYFMTIILIEKTISKVFKDYYDAKKAQKEEAKEEAEYEDILREIKKDLCGPEEKDDPVTNFIKKLRKIVVGKDVIKDVISLILTTIKRRIALGTPTKEEDFISFLKQEIGEDKKEVEQKIGEGGCCPCCDCWEKKKNPKVVVIKV